MTVLTPGANASLSSTSVKVILNWPTSAGVLDASAYLLTASGKVRGDKDMIFFNQRRDAAGSVAVLSSNAGSIAFQVETDRIPPGIERVVFCLAVETPGKTISSFNGISLAASGTAGSIATFDPDMSKASEAALIVAELYLRSGNWKIRAVAQGFNGGLAPLARSFGIDINETSAIPAPQAGLAPPPPVSAPKPISLSKITLDKAKPTVSLEKTGSSFGNIEINLNWTGGGTKSLFGKPKNIDLDLGCLYELQDGTIGAVQALGRIFGEYQVAPYIELSGDDRTGASLAGETLRVNGAQWGKIKRIALFAFIYEGAPNWGSTDGLVKVTMPNQPPIEFALQNGPNGLAFCGLALIENMGGTMKFTRIVDYFQGHKQYDERLSWGLQWSRGSK
jgi:tellurite resistance protein TerA